MRKVKRQLRVTLRLHVPLRSPDARLPRGKRAQFLGLLHVVEKSQHLAELIRRIGRNAFDAVFRIEPFQTLMSEVAYPQLGECSL
jgi:hypothetical protein